MRWLYFCILSVFLLVPVSYGRETQETKPNFSGAIKDISTVLYGTSKVVIVDTNDRIRREAVDIGKVLYGESRADLVNLGTTDLLNLYFTVLHGTKEGDLRSKKYGLK